MNIEIRTEVEGASNEAELLSLREWLLQENPRPGKLDVVARSESLEAMGSVAEALQVALGAGGAVSVLASSIGMWLTTRRSNLRMVLKRPSGEELTIDTQVKDPASLIERFLAVGSDTDN